MLISSHAPTCAIFALLLIIKDSSASADITKYKKCCETNEHLALTSTNHHCVPNTRKTSYFLSKTTNNHSSCLDQTVTNSTTQLLLLDNNQPTIFEADYDFHKCCPYGSVYEPEEHKCIETQTNHTKLFKNETNFVKIGLQCFKAAIVDHFYDTSSEFEKEMSKLPKKSYCADETTLASFVIRMCEDPDKICRSSENPGGTKCVRKCCLDGWMYKGNTKCTPVFTNGINISKLNFEEPQST